MNTRPDDSRRLDTLAVAIDRNAEVPVGLQLLWTLCTLIDSGEFQPGERLPGLRETAEASGLNVNTVRAVYQRLERRGLLESRQGSGTFVASAPRAPSAVGAIAAQAAREAAAIGVSPREVAAALYTTLSREGAAGSDSSSAVAAQDTHGDESSRRRALRAQIATLERAIGEIETEHPGVAPAPSPTRRGPGPTLLSAQELERVRSTLVQRLALVQSAIDARAAGSQAPAETKTPTSVKRTKTSGPAPAPRPWPGKTRALPT